MRPTARLRNALEAARGALWLWPAGAAVLGAVAAELLSRLDRSLDARGAQPEWVFGGDARAARSVLSTIASASMTVLGVTLTITLAVLTLTANAYSPRVVRRFMRDRLLQLVLAAFVGVVTFTLVAMRLVRTAHVPGVTVTTAVALALVALGLLIALFHHIASEVRVESIIRSIHEETLHAIEREFPDPPEPDGDVPDGPTTSEIRAHAAGRVRLVDEEVLARLAAETGGTLVVGRPAGDPVVAGDVVAHQVAGRPLSDEAAGRVRDAVVVGEHRTLQQDVAFGLRQLVDIALRSLSPGINDPTSAEEALWSATDILVRLARRDLRDSRVESGGRLLVLRRRARWDELVRLVLDQPRRTAEAQADAATMIVLLGGLARVARAVTVPDRLGVVREEARLVCQAARRSLPEARDVAAVDAAAALI